MRDRPASWFILRLIVQRARNLAVRAPGDTLSADYGLGWSILAFAESPVRNTAGLTLWISAMPIRGRDDLDQVPANPAKAAWYAAIHVQAFYTRRNT